MQKVNVTSVYVKSTNEIRTIKFSSPDKPEVNAETFERWQTLVNGVIKLANVKAALINKLNDGFTQIFLKSDNEDNAYKVGSEGKLCIGTYCEEVLGNNQALNVENANVDPVWSDSIYIKYQIISYYGLPLLWPDGEYFGTLCVLDTKPHVFSQEFIAVFESIKAAIENDLLMILKHKELLQVVEIDPLTLLENRRGISKQIEYVHNQAIRIEQPYCIIMIDIDFFKEINDCYGHQYGDEILKKFADMLKTHTRQSDIVGRYGGDEFIIIAPNTDREEAASLMSHVTAAIDAWKMINNQSIAYSYGIASSEEPLTPQELIEKADAKLYVMKQRHHRDFQK